MHMNNIKIFDSVDKSLVDFWKSHNLEEKDFYCRTCGKLMLDLDQIKDLKIRHFQHVGKDTIGLFAKRLVPPNEINRWLVLGRTLSGKTYFRHLCWDCFFDRLFKEKNDQAWWIKQIKRGRWYGKIAGKNRIVPAASTSPSFYFKWLFDITDEELAAETKKFDTASLESFIKRFGEEEGKKKFDAYSKRQAYTCSKEYMKETRGWTDEQWKEFNQSRASTKENFIKRYGEDLGTAKWDKYCAYESYAGNSLEWFISKYGKEEGNKIYLDVCDKKSLFKAYSNISQDLFRRIDIKLGNQSINSKYSEKNNEFEVFINIDGIKRIARLDYFLNRKVIEFNGDYWHANPTIYSSEDLIKFYNETKLAKDIWEADAKRNKAIEDLGYKIKVVWEEDYMKDRDKLVDECVKFLKEGIEVDT